MHDQVGRYELVLRTLEAIERAESEKDVWRALSTDAKYIVSPNRWRFVAELHDRVVVVDNIDERRCWCGDRDELSEGERRGLDDRVPSLLVGSELDESGLPAHLIQGGGSILVVTPRAQETSRWAGYWSSAESSLKRGEQKFCARLTRAAVNKLQHFALRQQVDDQHALLRQRHAELERVFRAVPHGIISFGPGGRLLGQQSATIEAWLGPYSAATSFGDLLARLDRRFSDLVLALSSQVFEGVLPPDLALSQLPSMLETKNRQFRFAYTPIYDDGSMEGILVVIEDTTELAQRKRRELHNAGVAALLRQGACDPVGIRLFLFEASRLVSTIESSETLRCPDVRQAVHTLKGMCAMQGLESLVRECHRFEDGLREGGAELCKSLAGRVVRMWRAIESDVRPVVDRSEGQMRISSDEYARVMLDLDHGDATNAARKMREWALDPVDSHFLRLRRATEDYVSRTMPGLRLEVACNSNDVVLTPDRYGELWSVVTHLIRNALYHGLRAHRGLAVICLSARASVLGWTLEVSDNGTGIDWDRVRQKATSSGLPSSTHDALVEALFAPGFSTSDTTNEHAGRGVGMCEVRRVVEALGGRIDVESARGRGTCWRMYFAQR